MNIDSSPIAAIATAPGRGGIGVVRASGKDLKAPLIGALFPGHRTAAAPRHLYPVQAGGRRHHRPGHRHLVQGAELLHRRRRAGTAGPRRPGRAATAAGARAGSGRRTRLAPGRARRIHAPRLLNDKLDLAQAEAVADLIDASTEAAAKSASQSLSGAFSKTVNALVDGHDGLRMLVEATLDFPEEEIDFLEKSDARGQLAGIVAALETVFRQAAQGALLREGLNVVLVGQPNVGKSSLLNALAGTDVAIVTPIAGTTRDKVTETIQIEGIPLNIIDTAGIRAADESVDVVERIGIERTWGEVGKADVILHLLDADPGRRAPMKTSLPPSRPACRCCASGTRSTCRVTSRRWMRWKRCHACLLSAHEHIGIDLLRTELLRIAGWQQTGESLYLARERHLIA
jgi:tRNA modification GTPase